jgi:Cyclin
MFQAATDEEQLPPPETSALSSDSTPAPVAGGVEHAPEVRVPAVETLEDIPDGVFTSALSSLLEQLLALNEKNGLARTCDEVDPVLHVFFSRHLQPFSLESYVERIVTHVPSRPVLVTALAYIDRIFEGNNDMALSPANMHRVFTVAVLLAYKFHEDEPCLQDFFRCIGGIPSLEELNELEVKYLNQIRWRCFIEGTVYNNYYDTLLARVNVLYPNGLPYIAKEL